VLRPGETTLSYFRQLLDVQRGKESRGRIDCLGAHVLRLEPVGKFFPLVVRTPTREIHLRACSDQDLRRWQSALLRAVAAMESTAPEAAAEAPAAARAKDVARGRLQTSPAGSSALFGVAPHSASSPDLSPGGACGMAEKSSSGGRGTAAEHSLDRCAHGAAGTMAASVGAALQKAKRNSLVPGGTHVAAHLAAQIAHKAVSHTGHVAGAVAGAVVPGAVQRGAAHVARQGTGLAQKGISRLANMPEAMRLGKKATYHEWESSNDAAAFGRPSSPDEAVHGESSDDSLGDSLGEDEGAGGFMAEAMLQAAPHPAPPTHAHPLAPSRRRSRACATIRPIPPRAGPCPGGGGRDGRGGRAHLRSHAQGEASP
jgi:hypothetical protein